MRGNQREKDKRERDEEEGEGEDGRERDQEKREKNRKKKPKKGRVPTPPRYNHAAPLVHGDEDGIPGVGFYVRAPVFIKAATWAAVGLFYF